VRVKICPGCRYSRADIIELYDTFAREWLCNNCPLNGTMQTDAIYPRDDYYNRPRNGPRFFQARGNTQ
jgi:hypothetical protein